MHFSVTILCYIFKILVDLYKYQASSQAENSISLKGIYLNAVLFTKQNGREWAVYPLIHPNYAVCLFYQLLSIPTKPY